MDIKGKVHCFFEQSGTFKNEFKKLGYIAEDYDIQNNFGETDNVVDPVPVCEITCGRIYIISLYKKKGEYYLNSYPPLGCYRLKPCGGMMYSTLTITGVVSVALAFK